MLRCSPWIVALLTLAALAAAGCSSDDNASPTLDAPASAAATTDTLSGSVNVFAASSLGEAFTAMGKTFESQHAGVKVTFNFAASSALAEQINQGGPADVFVSADEPNMKKVTDAGNASAPKTIARNRLAILVEAGNPKGISGLVDLAKPGVVFVLCAPEVPCGTFGAAALTKANVSAQPASLEENVKAVVSKVTLGEADAGIVYATDVKAAGDKAQGVDIDIADDPSLEAVYPIAATKQGANNDAAKAWIEFVLSPDGQATLATLGFLAP
jgi:molybdate transport system substrate-binding protein